MPVAYINENLDLVDYKNNVGLGFINIDFYFFDYFLFSIPGVMHATINWKLCKFIKKIYILCINFNENSASPTHT